MLKKKVGLAEIALVLSIAVLVVIVAVSVLLIFVTVFFKDGRLNITGVTEILSSSNTYFALKNSIVIALGTTALSTVIGVVLHGSLRALLVCLYSPAHFGVPVILGTEKGIYNIPTKIHERIYASSGSFEAISTGTILSAILVISAAIILKIQNSLLKEGRFQIIAGKSMRPVVLKLRGLKIPMLIVSILYILITVVLPTVTIFLIGGLKKYGLPFFLKNMTWNNYFEIFRWKMTKDAIWNSVFLSVGAAFVTMLASVMISYVTVKMKVCGKFALEFLGVLPFSIPCTVIANCL
jgi:ABC-type Fe3+ transport system, permease component